MAATNRSARPGVRVSPSAARRSDGTPSTSMTVLPTGRARLQSAVELLAIEYLEAQGGLVEHQELGVDRHHQCQVQLHDHALGQLAYTHLRLELGVGQEALAAGAGGARVNPGNEL